MSSVVQQPQAQQQHQNQQNNLTQFQGHTLGNVNVVMESQLSHSQQQQQQQHPPPNINSSMLPPHHSIPSNACSVMQQQILENHHQSVMQQVNIPHQHSSHQVPHPGAHSHHHHHGHTSQQYMPFGMSLNANNMGNGNSYGGGHPMNPFHPHNHGHQIPDQQPTHAMNMSVNGLHPNCFMQTCLHFQSNPPPLPQAVNAQRVSAAMGWISGPTAAPHHATMAHGSTNHNNNSANINACIAAQNVVPKCSSSSRVQTPMLADPAALPGGIEILWRELPPDCQKIMVPQDIPDSARCRGYFTVCELLMLKRGLESRFMGSIKSLANSPAQKIPLNKVVQGRAGKGEGQSKRGPKRGTGKDRTSIKGYRSTDMSSSEKDNNTGDARDGGEMDLSSNNMNATEMMQEDADGDNSLYGELMINLGDMKNEIHTTVTSAVTGVGVGVGGAVKEAMDALTSTVNADQNGDGVGNTSSTGEGSKEENGMKMLMRKDSDSDELVINESPINNVSALIAPGETQENNDSNNGNGGNEMMHQRTTMSNELAVVPQLSTMPGLFTQKSSTGENALASASNCSDLSTSSCAPVAVNEESKEGKGSEANGQQKPVEVAVTTNTNDMYVSNLSTSTPVQVSTSVGSGGGYSVAVSRYTGTPPPSRTQTLVLKLLQIGTYHIRSFSSVNPNRLRVLFNTQRMTYECQLPVIPPEKLAPGTHPVRKVLTIDIGFEQISKLRFGDDSLWMRVEGAPLLTIAFNNAQDEEGSQVLSPHDQFVLDAIEKGQLKLSPTHQLYFLNERLVHTLQSQFREHPRFRNLLTEMGNF